MRTLRRLSFDFSNQSRIWFLGVVTAAKRKDRWAMTSFAAIVSVGRRAQQHAAVASIRRKGVVLDRAHHINIDDRHVEWPSAGITTGRPMKSRVPDVLRNIENFKRTFEPYRS
jgi:hypothetical protein